MSSNRVVRGFVLAFALFAALATPAAAQEVRGRVVDDGSEEPVPDAVVVLLDAAGRERVRGATDSEGAFRLRVGAGSFAMRVQHVAFVTYTSAPLELARGETVHVELRLGAATVPLEPLLVTARRRPRGGGLAEFERRRLDAARAGGHFITREDIERRSASTPSTLVGGTPGVSLRAVQAGPSSVGPERYLITMPGACVARMFIDGVPASQTTLTTADDVITTASLGGVEVYPRASQVPIEYRGESQCGAVLYWTREGERGGSWSWRRMAVGISGLAALFLLAMR